MNMKSLDEQERSHEYDRKILSIRKLQSSIVELQKLKEEHAKLGGFFKKKARLAVEEKMRNTEKTIAETKNAFNTEK